MPIYEYECTECGHRTELLQRFGDPPLASCPECDGAVHKLFSAPAVQFKGSGWYVTDYAGKGKSKPADTSAKSDQGSGDAGSSEKAAAAKETPGAKTESKPAAGGD